MDMYPYGGETLMPTYQLRCQSCNKETELFLKMSDSKEGHKCPECTGNLIHEIVLGSKYQNFQLKGPDWPGQSIKKFKIFPDD